MSTVQPTDKVLVNRAGTDYSTTADTLMATIQDTDLLLVNRAGVDYKCSGLDFKAAMKPPVTINKPSITSPADGAGQTVTPQSDEITAVAAGTSPPITTYEARGVTTGIVGAVDFSGAEPGFLNPIPSWDSLAATTYTGTVGSQPVQTGGADAYYDFHQYKLDAPGSVAFVRYPSALPGSMFLVYHSDDGVTWTFDAGAAALGVANGITMYPDIAVHGTTAHQYWAIARINTADYTGKVSTAVITATAAFNYGIGTSVTVPTTILTLKTDKDLAMFKTGGTVTEQIAGGAAGDATGVIAAVDATAKTITLGEFTGTWDVGNYVLGTPGLSADAALGETPTFTSSAFATTGGSLTHSSSDWQVTTKADTGFASPVVQSMTDTTNLVRWDGGPLQPNTDYIVKVRHNGGGKSSPWSDAVNFKTKVTFP